MTGGGARSSRWQGALLALATAALLAAQDPLSAPAAHKLKTVQYILTTQVVSLIVAPMMLFQAEARRDFIAIFASRAGRRSLFALTALGLAGLLLYNLGLSRAHPVVVAAILNLSPFWAAMVARVVAGVKFPAGPAAFAGSLVVAFGGAMVVAYSQIQGAGLDGHALVKALRQGSWYFAIPVPLFTALSGTLIALWFKAYHETAAVSAALFAPALLLVPLCLGYLATQSGGFAFDGVAVALLMAGVACAAAIGRLFYQFALSRTDNDNGFVTMFFLLAPALAGAYSWALAGFVPDLKFSANATYFVGLAVTALALLAFARASREG